MFVHALMYKSLIHMIITITIISVIIVFVVVVHAFQKGCNLIIFQSWFNSIGFIKS